jgi:hypothetical protein
MTLIKDLIDVPERVHQGDFVLKLTEGVTRADATLRDYVVTPQLEKAFDNALGFAQQALNSGQSKAAYLHGSFGAGKSHFMAILHLLMAGNTQARAIPELADTVARHAWVQGRKFLMVPYHMVGARDMESAVLGQYADHVRRLHPEAPIPGFYQAEGLFRDAADLRARLGDATFFSELNAKSAASGAGGGWGALEGGWNASSFDAALLEPPTGAERTRLVGDLINGFFSAYRSIASDGESFVSFDAGLAIMSRHASELGYDAVILFLDELVLWLASHASDVNFVSREGTKLVKLVEATHLQRPAPLISFIARQRDLRELVGDSLPGAIGVQFTDVLRHWEARFHRITLEDRNLPAIAQKRVLRAVSPAARLQLDQSFDETLKLRKDVLDTLLTTDADREMFRQVYPFSPALVQTLIAVSAALQRERTALKLMLQLLVDRRADLELGQLIPVGDLWDAIAEGDEPFSEAMRLHFDNAKRLYTARLLPMLETRHGCTWQAIKLGQADAAVAKNLRNDARLLKTLLLAALVPEVESLKGLTAQRLAALNHGTFRSPIPGQEAAQVLRKLRDWAGEIGEIKVGEDQNPLISIQITGVDLEPVLRAAETNDNQGNRRKLVRELLFSQLGVKDAGSLFTRHDFLWRGTQREVDVMYENVCDLADDRLRGRPDAWSVIIDYPFDERNRTPQDDLARLSKYRGGTARTLVWLPSFLSLRSLQELGRLVILDHILQGDRFEQYAGHLSLIDRTQAKALARNQHDSLRIKLKSQLEVAYGIRPEPSDAVTHALTPDQQLRSLDPTLEPRPPVGADLASAFANLLDQLFAHQYPAHPEFETEIKASVAKKLWTELQTALESPQWRAHVVDIPTRKLVRAIVPACKLGQTSENSVVLDAFWSGHFAQSMAREGIAVPTVGKLREWLDQPRPMGLPVEMQDLVILCFAAQTNRRFTLNGGPCQPDIGRLSDAMEVREQTLPSDSDWKLATDRASQLFGLTPPTVLNASNVAQLVSQVRNAVAEKRSPVRALVQELQNRIAQFVGRPSTDRQRSAESAMSLISSLANAEDAQLVSVLASAPLETSATAVGRTLGKAGTLKQSLELANWGLFDALAQLTDARRVQAEPLLAKLAEVLSNDEHVLSLQDTLAGLQSQGMQVLTRQVETVVVPPLPGPPPRPPEAGKPGTPRTRVVTVEEQSQMDLSGDAAGRVLDELKAKLAAGQGIELSLTWRLQRRETE